MLHLRREVVSGGSACWAAINVLHRSRSQRAVYVLPYLTIEKCRVQWQEDKRTDAIRSPPHRADV